jgi:hypothetical protein
MPSQMQLMGWCLSPLPVSMPLVPQEPQAWALWHDLYGSSTSDIFAARGGSGWAKSKQWLGEHYLLCRPTKYDQCSRVFAFFRLASTFDHAVFASSTQI